MTNLITFERTEHDFRLTFVTKTAAINYVVEAEGMQDVALDDEENEEAAQFTRLLDAVNKQIDNATTAPFTVIVPPELAEIANEVFENVADNEDFDDDCADDEENDA